MADLFVCVFSAFLRAQQS